MTKLYWWAPMLLACGDDTPTGAVDTTAVDIATEVSTDTVDTSPDVAETRDTVEASDAPDTTDTTDTTDTEVTPSALMRVHMLDVGQGEAIIVEFPCGAMLVDTGGEVTEAGAPGGGFDSDTALESQIRDFFAARPDLDDTFDLVVLSHPHFDHTRGVTRLLELVETGDLRIRNVLTNGYEASGNGPGQQRALHDFADDTPDVGRWYLLQRTTGTTGVHNEVIDPFADCQGVDPKITALWGNVDPASTVTQSWTGDDYSNANNHSVVLRVDFGAASLLMTGDLEEAAIASLMAQYAGTGLLDVDLYKVGHHGSYNGTTAAFVNAMSPKTAIISAGPATREADFTAWEYGLPRWRAVSDLLGDNDSVGVTADRKTPIEVLVGVSYSDGHGNFEPRDIAPAVYCTGWERGPIVVGLHADGNLALP